MKFPPRGGEYCSQTLHLIFIFQFVTNLFYNWAPNVSINMPDIHLVYIKAPKHHCTRPAPPPSLKPPASNPPRLNSALVCHCFFSCYTLVLIKVNSFFVFTLFEVSCLLSLCIECVMRMDGSRCETFEHFLLKRGDVASLLNNLWPPKPQFTWPDLLFLFPFLKRNECAI